MNKVFSTENKIQSAIVYKEILHVVFYLILIRKYSFKWFLFIYINCGCFGYFHILI